jgi:hypothetical protein
MFREFAEGDQKTRNDLDFRRRHREAEERVNDTMTHFDHVADVEQRRVSLRVACCYILIIVILLLVAATKHGSSG